jgi:hypothetical protein
MSALNDLKRHLRDSYDAREADTNEVPENDPQSTYLWLTIESDSTEAEFQVAENTAEHDRLRLMGSRVVVLCVFKILKTRKREFENDGRLPEFLSQTGLEHSEN